MRDAYRNALYDLLFGEEGTLSMLASVAPHLCEEEVRSILERVGKGEDVWVAAPPLRVNWSYIALCASSEKPGQFTPRPIPSHLMLVDSVRQQRSYADGVPKGDPHVSSLFEGRAIAYAQQHWGDQLILDTWSSHVSVDFMDCCDVDEHGYPKEVDLAFFVTAADLASLAREGSPQHLNDSIVEVTTCLLAGLHELDGGPRLYDRSSGSGYHFRCYACSRCGSVLEPEGCPGCRVRFTRKDLALFANQPLRSLPQKVIECLLAKGHNFQKAAAG